MPTGYTYDVQKGKINTLEGFVKECGRAFIWQARDSNEKDLRKLVREGTRDSSYYEKRLEEVKKDLFNLRAMTDKEWEKRVERENKNAEKRYNEQLKEMKETEDRYNAMLAKVKAWNPPTDKHIEIKKFMISQLEDSLKFDVYPVKKPTLEVNDQDYRDDVILDTLEEIARLEGELDKVKRNNNLGIEWVEQLLQSVEGK